MELMLFKKDTKDFAEEIERSHVIVNQYTAAAVAEAATPIPFSDAVLLVPTQVAMISHITACFGLEVKKSFFTSLAGTILTTFVGSSICANLLKLIPGVGTIIGGAISATVAGAVTKAFGEAYILLMIEVKKGKISLDDINAVIEFLINIIKNRLPKIKI